MTKDELFVKELYKHLKEQETVDPFLVGRRLGYSERQVKNILRGLMQANFVKRFAEGEVALTSLGEELARSLLKS